MSFVLYDVETTGLSKRFDQIVQFAALRADADMRITDRLEIRCRLMPHIIPSPEALHVTGLRIERLIHPHLPSHYEMVCEMRRTLEAWCPALFLGFNSISFDEEFLRHAFYQCLYDAYLTNTQGSARADVLSLCRMTAAIRPDALTAALDENGRSIFKLRALAEANGITTTMAHDAMADVLSMHALCGLVRNRAPDIWSQFLRFSQKASVQAFVENEDAFIVSEMVGNQHRTRVVTRVGQHSTMTIRQYCIDLSTDLNRLRGLSHDALSEICKRPDRPLVTVRTNAAPTLWTLDDATIEHLAPLSPADTLERAQQVRDDQPFMDRLCKAAEAAEKTYPPSPHVEEQLYERSFAPDEDKNLMTDFHRASWDERASLARRFTDERYRRLAMRLVFFARPDLLPPERQLRWQGEVRNRVLAPLDADVRWRSIAAAKQEADAIIARGITGEDLARHLEVVAYLNARTTHFSSLLST